MKFKQFEFRLFPRISSRKKKKAGKPCNYDFPRDIGLDRNSNYNNCYYDDLAISSPPNYTSGDSNADDIYRGSQNGGNYVNGDHYMNYSGRQSTNLMECSFMSYSPETRIYIDTNQDVTANEPDCMIVSSYSDRLPLHYTLDIPTPSTPSDSYSTLPRTRTRIKTNPWLPSPRDTPSSTYSDIPLSCSADAVAKSTDNHSNRLIGYSNTSLLLHLDDPYQNNTTSTSGKHSIKPIHSTIQLPTDIATSINRPDISENSFSSHTQPLQDTSRGTISTPTRKRKHIDSSPGSKVDSYCSEIKSVCDDGFTYEDSVDELLETGLIPRDDTFESINESVKVSEDAKNDVDNNNHNISKGVKSISPSVIDSNKHSADVIRSKSDELIIDDTKLPQEDYECPKSYVKGSKHNKLIRHNKSKSLDDNLDALHEADSLDHCLSCQHMSKKSDSVRAGNLQDSIDTGYGSASRDIDSDSISSEGLLDNTNDHTSDIELEWDNEPTTELLTIENSMVYTSTEIEAIGKTGDLRTRGDMDEVGNMETDDIFDNGDNKSGKGSRPIVSRDWMSMSVCIANAPGESNGVSDPKVVDKVRAGGRKVEKCAAAIKRRSRSLADIEISLDEKVNMLREEKTYVQRKIQESIYEERIKQQQERVMKGLNQTQRKEVLMKTLYDLKTRLEDQSERLQSSYSTILTLRKRFSQRKGNLGPLETEV